jgi:hypothetical protein
MEFEDENTKYENTEYENTKYENTKTLKTQRLKITLVSIINFKYLARILVVFTISQSAVKAIDSNTHDFFTIPTLAALSTLSPIFHPLCITWPT